jgi:uncharacterized membrane protein YdjX (TVP38/TMEM64 family)
VKWILTVTSVAIIIVPAAVLSLYVATVFGLWNVLQANLENADSEACL